MGLIRYLFGKNRHDKLPHLINHLSTPYAIEETRHTDEGLLMLAGLVKDPDHARLLMSEYGVSSAAELLRKIPRRRIDVKGRFLRWIQSVEGSSTVDPHLEEYKALRREIEGM